MKNSTQTQINTFSIFLALFALIFSNATQASAEGVNTPTTANWANTPVVTSNAIPVSIVPINTAVSNSSSSAPIVLWPEIQARSAFVFNPLTNQVLYAKNPDSVHPVASLLKIMTAATVDNLLNASPSLEKIKIKIPNAKNENLSDTLLKTGTTWEAKNLTEYMLIGSSNKAAEALASGLVPRSSFISLMNFYAKKMGLTHTFFRNPTGLTIGKTTVSNIAKPGVKASTTETVGDLAIAGGVSTAREVAQMMWNVISENPNLLDITHFENAVFKVDGKDTVIVNNTNKLLKNFPITFGKTGFTENAGGNLAIVMQKDARATPYIIVVLGSTIDKRFDDAAALASTTMKLIDLVK